MPQHLTLAVSQSRTLSTTAATLSALNHATEQAAGAGAHLLLFPECYLGGYPRTCTFGSSIGSRSEHGRDQFLQYFQSAVDLGDTPAGAKDDWIERRLDMAKGTEFRGDGTREKLEMIARNTGVFLVVGVVERAGCSLYCSVVYVCPRDGCIGKRRKIMPTGSERLIWAQGSPSTLKAVTTTIEGIKITLAAAICWENYMPLLRFSLYSQNVNLYLAPTADARDTWVPLMQTVAIEGRAFVLSANQCVRKKSLPHWIAGGKCSSIDERGEGGESTYKPARRLRRSSTITKTEDNHEITWPLPESSKILESTFLDEIKHSSSIVSDDGPENNDLEASFPELTRQKSMTTKIEHNHEITWPSPEAKQQSQNSEIPEYSTKITTPSPLRVSTVPVDNDEPEKVEEGFKNTKFPSIVPKSSSSSIPSKDHYIALPAGASSSSVSIHAIPRNPQVKPPSNPELDPSDDEFICRGGSCIISPTGAVIAGPLWEVEDGGLLYATVDFDDCVRGKLDMDVVGSYGRGDVFELKVKDLDLSPPP